MTYTHSAQNAPEALSHQLLALWAADCAMRVLACFEEAHSEDSRPRQAIEAGRAWARGEIGVAEARTAAFAAHAAARETSDAGARAAARAAGHAAATAHVAGHARHAAAYAARAAKFSIGKTLSLSAAVFCQAQEIGRGGEQHCRHERQTTDH